MAALQQKVTPRAPIWMMRQAGRYLPEYLKLKQEQAGGDFWRMIHEPDLATEITLQPWERFKTDALILFSDILTPFPAMGLDVRYIPHPVLEKNAYALGIENLTLPNPEQHFSFVGQTIQKIKKRNPTPLIGFVGGPYTLACYALQKGKFDAHLPKQLFYSEPQKYHQLLEKISETLQAYIAYQIKNGVDSLMIFDSWVGALSIEQYQQMAEPYLSFLWPKKNAQASCPMIYFGLGGAHLLSLWENIPIQALGLDWRMNLNVARTLFLGKKALQGNFDYNQLFAPKLEIEQQAKKILKTMAGYPGFIFNLGHGILPNTPLENVAHLFSVVQNTPYAKLR